MATETHRADRKRGWYADFHVEVGKNRRRGYDYYVETRKVEIVQTPSILSLSPNVIPHFWCTFDGVGEWPGTDSDEWIEYIPDPSLACTDLIGPMAGDW